MTYTLPHPLDRQYQQETANRVIRSLKKYIIIHAPPGSGKSAIAAFAASIGLKVLVVVRTKSYQNQYRDNYGFTVITGKNNYSCLGFGNQTELFDIGIEQTADLCTVSEAFKYSCRENCPYWQARHEFINAQAGVMNYAKFLRDRKLVEDFEPDILVLDEAHELSGNPSEVINFSGLSLKWTKKLLNYTDKIFIKKPQPIARGQGREWLQSLYSSLKYNPPQHPEKGGSAYLWKWHKARMEEIDVTLAAMDIKPNVWFIDSDNDRFLAKPLTSEFHFKPLFNKAPKIVLMSATIQQADIDALGLTPDEYDYIRVPNTIEPEDRPVYDLGGPAYTKKTSLADRKEHAKLIAKLFHLHPAWNGLIHTTGYDMSCELADLMKLPNPIFISERSSDNGKGTDIQYQEWQDFNSRYENAICVSHQFHAGADMGDVAICVTARVPWPYMGDPFEKARIEYSWYQARARVSNVLEQQPGRIRRGFAEHYGPNARKFCAITDSKWKKLKSSMNPDFLRSIVKWTF